MELEDLKELIELLRGTDITELQLEKDGTKVKIRREKLLSSIEMSAQRPADIYEKVIQQTEEDTQRLITVTSPIVGTFYRSPSPDAPPLVEVGLRIKKGQVLCIIEAMKVLSEIKADVSGTIVEVLATNGQPVEYGQPLFRVRPD